MKALMWHGKNDIRCDTVDRPTAIKVFSVRRQVEHSNVRSSKPRSTCITAVHAGDGPTGIR
jgi:hypothetical protein